MTMQELFPAIQSLPRGDKLRLLELLAADIARDEDITNEYRDKTFTIWSPHDSKEGAAALFQVLKEQEGQQS